MAIYRDHGDRLVTPAASSTTIVEERDHSAGLIAGLIVAVVVVGLIAWALFNGGILGEPAIGADAGVQPGPAIHGNGTQSGGAAGNQIEAR